MLKTKRHPGRFMYECRLCVQPQSQPADDQDARSSHSLNPDPMSTKGSSAVPSEPLPSISAAHDPGGSSHQLNPSSSQTQVSQHPQTQTYEASKPQGVGVCHPSKPETPLGDAVHTDVDSELRPESSHVFCSNYATQFHVHLLEKHKEAFQTKEEVSEC